MDAHESTPRRWIRRRAIGAVASGGRALRVVGTAANPGWTVEVERALGREVEVTFRTGARRIDVDAELEDGEIRTSVRERAGDDSTGRTTDDSTGTTTDDSTGTTADDHGGDSDRS
jgi:hypothetical protein